MKDSNRNVSVGSNAGLNLWDSQRVVLSSDKKALIIAEYIKKMECTFYFNRWYSSSRYKKYNSSQYNGRRFF